MPYSVTTQCTSPRAIATGSSGASCGRIAGRPAGVRDARQTIALPPGDASAPRWNAGPVDRPP